MWRTGQDLVKDLRALAEDELGLDALVEVHSSEELTALDANAKIIGVNNRISGRFGFVRHKRSLIAKLTRRVMISESAFKV